MSDWDRELTPGDRSRDQLKAQKLANAISRLKGTREAKVRFLYNRMELLESTAAQRFDPIRQRREFGQLMVSLAFRYWRNHLSKRGVSTAVRGSRELPQQQGRREEGRTEANKNVVHLADYLPGLIDGQSGS
jgi:hypothetical protein